MKKIKSKNITKIVENLNNKSILNTFLSEIEKLFLKDYLTTELVLLFYDNISYYEAEELRSKKNIKNSISKKTVKIMKKLNKKEELEILFLYKEIITELNNKEGYLYEKIWNSLYKHGKEKKIFNFPVEVDNFITEYNLIDELLSQLSIQDIIELYNNNIIKINIKNNYDEFVSVTQRITVQTLKKFCIIKLENQKKFVIEMSSKEFYRI